MVLLVCGFCEQPIESTDPTTKHIIHTKKGLTIIKCLEWSENFQRAKSRTHERFICPKQ